MDISVTKRDGTTEGFDISKLKRAISWACEGLDVNPISLESVLQSELISGIKTSEIQERVILAARRLFSSQEPDWSIVAGRSAMMNLWKNTTRSRGFEGYNREGYDFNKYLNYQVSKNRYDPTFLDFYSVDDIKELQSLISDDLDLIYDYAGFASWQSTYLLEDELPQEAIMTIAMNLGTVENPENRMEFVKTAYKEISERRLSLATPMLGNLRKLEGNASSCFVMTIDDSRESIMAKLDEASAISKNGGGVGVCFSNIRSSGSAIQHVYGRSGGVVPFIHMLNESTVSSSEMAEGKPINIPMSVYTHLYEELKKKLGDLGYLLEEEEEKLHGVPSFVRLFDSMAVAINQLGKRKGAVTVALDVWHRDVLDFLELKLENKDHRLTAHDVFPQLVVNDVFMERVEASGKWVIVDPYEVKQVLGYDLAQLWGDEFRSAYGDVEESFYSGDLKLGLEIDAKEILRKVIQSYQSGGGLPYIWFKDTVNRANPNKGSGVIPCGNLCQESYSNTSFNKTHVCNLVSVNLANTTLETLETSVKTAVRILDNAIDITNEPSKHSRYHNASYRVIGLGDLGLADYMAREGIKYSVDNPEFLDKLEQLFELQALYAAEESVKLASERGTFYEYPTSEWSKGLVYCRDSEFYATSPYAKRWGQLFENLSQHGIRNSQLLAIAPNTSSALIQGCTPSILPARDLVYQHKKGNGVMSVAVPFIKENRWYYRPAKSYRPMEIIQIVQKIQKWIDTGISMELLLEFNEKASYIRDCVLEAWKGGTKAIYYVRFTESDEESSCTSCAN